MIFILINCAVPENIHTPPEKGFEFPRGWVGGGGGVCKAKNFKEMYEAQLEFPEGWGVFRGRGMDIFWN